MLPPDVLGEADHSGILLQPLHFILCRLETPLHLLFSFAPRRAGAALGGPDPRFAELQRGVRPCACDEAPPPAPTIPDVPTRPPASPRAPSPPPCCEATAAAACEVTPMTSPVAVWKRPSGSTSPSMPSSDMSVAICLGAAARSSSVTSELGDFAHEALELFSWLAMPPSVM